MMTSFTILIPSSSPSPLSRPPMARIISQALIPRASAPSAARLLTVRGRSHRPDAPPPQLIEVDLDTSADDAAETLGMRRLEDAIHGIIVRRSAPDWLPFVPGSSYWVPPQRRRSLGGFIGLVGKLAEPLPEEESLSLTTRRGWPSLAYFVEGTLPHLAKNSTEVTTQSDDEE